MKTRAWLFAALLALPTAQALADGEVQKLITAADLGSGDAHGGAGGVKGRRAGRRCRTRHGSRCWAISWSGFDMVGDWQCRTIKAGGLAKLVVYGWFKCRVSDDGSGWMLEKVSGSQRTKGRFFDDGEKRLIYLGSFHVAGATAKPYASGPESDQVGYAFRTGPQEWRIEFPAPYYESKLDILEFRR